MVYFSTKLNCVKESPDILLKLFPLLPVHIFCFGFIQFRSFLEYLQSNWPLNNSAVIERFFLPQTASFFLSAVYQYILKEQRYEIKNGVKHCSYYWIVWSLLNEIKTKTLSIKICENNSPQESILPFLCTLIWAL